MVFFNRLAEIAGEYLHKGSKVYIEGALRTRKWQDKEGRDQYTTEIVAGEMQMLDGRREGGNDAQGGYAGNEQQHRQPPRTSAPQPATEPPAWDDDIPF